MKQVTEVIWRNALHRHTPGPAASLTSVARTDAAPGVQERTTVLNRSIAKTAWVMALLGGLAATAARSSPSASDGHPQDDAAHAHRAHLHRQAHRHRAHLQ